MTEAKRWEFGVKNISNNDSCTVCRALGRHKPWGLGESCGTKGSSQLRMGVGAEAAGGSVRFPSWNLLIKSHPLQYASGAEEHFHGVWLLLDLPEGSPFLAPGHHFHTPVP